MSKSKGGRRAAGSGAIYKDGDIWRARVLIGHDPATGKPRYKKIRATTQDGAVKALATLQHAARTTGLTASGANLANYAHEWLETRVRPARAPKTYASYRWVIETHVLPTLGKKRVGAVTRRDVQQLVTALTSQPCKPRSANPTPGRPVRLLGRRTLQLATAVLHAVFEDAIRDGLATSNPSTYIVLPTAVRTERPFLDSDQVGALAAALDGSPARELITFMLATGTRVGEATGVRRIDLDLERGFVHVRGQLQREDGKLAYRATTKTNQDRKLPLSPWLAADLKTMLAGHMVQGFEDPDGLAFLNEYGRRWDPKSVNAEIKRACLKAGVPEVSAHALRHSFATVALAASGDLHGVQKALGHSQVNLTANLYAHAAAEGLRRVTDAVSRAIRPTLD